MGLAKSMRQDWDARARKDAFFYIASWRKGWDVDDFLKSGEQDYQRLVAPILSRFGFSPEGKTMLELGCGVGRMTHSFAARFDSVIAVDVSAQMLDRAQQMLDGMKNIVWIQSNGLDLGGVATESVDFAFSYLVLQHLPDERLVHGYVREMFRILKAPGVCLFQFHGTHKPTMNWTGRLAWACVNTLWSIHLPVVSRLVARLFGFDPGMAGRSWHGTAVLAKSIAETVKASGGSVLEMRSENTPMAWCCARR